MAFFEQSHKFILPLTLLASVRMCANSAPEYYYRHYFPMWQEIHSGQAPITFALPLPLALPLYVLWQSTTNSLSILTGISALSINPVDKKNETEKKPVMKEIAKATAAFCTTYIMNKLECNPFSSFGAGLGAATLTHMVI